MNEDGESVFVCERKSIRNAGMREGEALRTGVELDSASARSDRVLALGERIGMGVEPTEGDEVFARSGGRCQDGVVGAPVATLDMQREGHRPRAEQIER